MSFPNHKGRPTKVGGSLPRNNLGQLFSILKGGPNSGNRGHAGRLGKRGGSAPAIPGAALAGVDTSQNYKNAVGKVKSHTQEMLDEFKGYFPERLKDVKVPSGPEQQDIDWANSLDLYHRTSSGTAYREGLLPASVTGKTSGSRYYDESLGRLDAVFLSIGKTNTNLDYGSNVFTAKAGEILNKPNSLVGKDIGDMPAEGNGPGVGAYKKTLMKGSDYLNFLAYERTLNRFEDNVINTHNTKDPYTSKGLYEVLHFGPVSVDEIEKVR